MEKIQGRNLFQDLAEENWEEKIGGLNVIGHEEGLHAMTNVHHE
jgi:hypothetical protein